MADKVQATDLTVTGVNAITLNAGDTLEILPGVRVSTDSGFAGVYSTGSNVTVGVDGTLFGDNAIFLASGSANDTVLVGTQGILSAFHNTVDIAGSGDSVTNSGQIMSLEGDGVSLGAGSHVTNSGSITGALAGIVATAGSTVDNSGTIQGGVQFTAGNNFLYNDNNGSTITGSVDMGSGGGKIDNDGYIHGDVDLGGATTRLNNNGTITGNIAGTGGATIFNYGTIDGSLSFSAASTYHGETGIITGSITGSSGDDNIFLGSNPYNHHLTGGAGDDVINASGGGTDVFYGGLGADKLGGSAGKNIYVYKHVDESRGGHYDTIGLGFDGKIDLNVAVHAVDPVVGENVNVQLDKGPNFTTELATILGPAQLHAHDAVAVVVSEGSLARTEFLVVDANGIAGYQAAGDYVIACTAIDVDVHSFI